MPTLRFKINISKKTDKPIRNKISQQNFRHTLKKYFHKLFNSDSLPYIMAPLLFFAMMYLEWLYLFLL